MNIKNELHDYLISVDVERTSTTEIRDTALKIIEGNHKKKMVECIECKNEFDHGLWTLPGGGDPYLTIDDRPYPLCYECIIRVLKDNQKSEGTE